MEANRSVERKIQRKPLGDCTNIASRSSQQSSYSSTTLLKFANPSLTSSLKRLVDQTTLNEKSVDVNNSKAGAGSSSRSISTSARPLTRRMFADLGFKRPKPSRPPEPRSGRGVSDKEVADPYSVYTVRRKASVKKSNKDESSSGAVTRLRLDLISSSGKKIDQTNENKPKPLKVAPKKRQRMVKHEEDNLVHAASQDYIKEQRAYFAEVDAFELPEEEVTSSDLD